LLTGVDSATEDSVGLQALRIIPDIKIDSGFNH